MSITPQVVQHVARLARLEISREETDRYAGQLSRILDLAERLNALPTGEVAPMTHAVALTMPERDDAVTGVDQRQAMLANAPDHAEECFRTPKFVE